jgi:fatty-acyl-CoA synthase
VALINTRLVGRSLAHCIDTARADHVIVAAECVHAFETARPHLERVPRIWSLGDIDAGSGLDAALAASDPGRLSAAERGNITIDDNALLIYTSGTPAAKAAMVSHRRVLMWGGWFAGRQTSVDDRPTTAATPSFRRRRGRALQHALRWWFGGYRGKVLGRGLGRRRALRLHGLPIYRRALPLPAEGAGVGSRGWHRLRLAVGNGLHGDIWEAFAGRFGIPRTLDSTPRPRAIFRCSTSKGNPARSAESRRCWRTAFLPRS